MNMFLRSPTRVGNQSAVSEDLSRKIVVGWSRENFFSSFELDGSPASVETASYPFWNIFLANNVFDTKLATKMTGNVRNVQGPIIPALSTHMTRELVRTTSFQGKILKAIRERLGLGSLSSGTRSTKKALLAPIPRERRDDRIPMMTEGENLPVEKPITSCCTL